MTDPAKALVVVNLALSESAGLSGITAKIDIGDHDLYVKTAWIFETVLEPNPLDVARQAEDDLLGEDSPQLTFARTRVRIVRVDATMSQGGSDRSERQAIESLEASRFDIVRMWMESELQIASDLLASQAASPEHLIEWWLGRRGYPSGYCRALSFVNAETGMLQPMPVSGPFDAIAKLFRARLAEWERIMLTNR